MEVSVALWEANRSEMRRCSAHISREISLSATAEGDEYYKMLIMFVIIC